jgi:hypothetical protein
MIATVVDENVLGTVAADLAKRPIWAISVQAVDEHIKRGVSLE